MEVRKMKPVKIWTAVISLTVLSVLFLSIPVLANTAEIENSGKARYKSVWLTPDIYNNANPDLSDILIKDSQGGNIPYFIYNAAYNTKDYFSETIAPEFTTEEKDKYTYINIQGLKNLKLEAVCIETDGIFNRTAAAPFGVKKEIYSLPSGDTDTELFFEHQISNSDILTVSIQNNDDAPITITGITVRYCADEIVFEDKGETSYTLYFGADKSKTAPIYDIVTYKDEILSGDIDKLSMKNIIITEQPAAEQPKPQYDLNLIFNITAVAIAILLAFLILFNLKKKHQ